MLSHYAEGFKFVLEIRCFIFSGYSWFCMATTNFSAQLSQASGVFAAMRGNKVTEDREFPVSPAEEEPWELQVSYRKMHQPSNCLNVSSICIYLDQLVLASLYSTAIRCISCQSKPVSHKMQVPFFVFWKDIKMEMQR